MNIFNMLLEQMISKAYIIAYETEALIQLASVVTDNIMTVESF